MCMRDRATTIWGKVFLSCAQHSRGLALLSGWPTKSKRKGTSTIYPLIFVLENDGQNYQLGFDSPADNMLSPGNALRKARRMGSTLDVATQ